ncbi:hypothetical protein [Microbacterium terrisoli]|uniref:hypothetical protein n=1 Tax=Microbacterium terrisoli TaxID=3242192 RepID=UPI002804DCA8|nr:hypothetical protein [Microbacterium protaetiae]
MSVIHADAHALRASRRVLRERADRPRASDVAYRAYVTVLVGVIVLIPFGRAVVLTMAASLATDGVPPAAVAAGGSLLCLGLFLAGAVCGPAFVSMPYLNAVVDSSIDRRLTLRRAQLRGQIIVMVSVAAVAALAVMAASSVTVVGAVAAPVAAAALGSIAGSLWLAGQLRPPWWVTLIISVWLVAAAGAGFVPAVSDLATWVAPGGWAAQVGAGTVGAGMPQSALSVSTLLALGLLIVTAAVGWLVAGSWRRRLRRDELARQARRWSVVAALSLSADVSSATRVLATPAHGGRHWNWTIGRTAASTIVRRDVAGLLRAPARTATAAVACVGLGALVGWAAGGVFAVLAAVLLYFAVGGWATGLRTAASSVGAATFYGLADRERLLLHTIVPGVASLAFCAAGAALTGGVGGAIWAAALALFVVLLQGFASLRGALPSYLLTPIPSPVGDLAIVNVLVWMADAVLLTAVFGGIGTYLVASIPAAAALALIGGVVIAAFWAGARLRHRTRG